MGPGSRSRSRESYGRLSKCWLSMPGLLQDLRGNPGPCRGRRTGQGMSAGILVTWGRLPISGECIEQRLGVSQIRGVKPLGEPVVDLGQQPSGFVKLTMLLPQST